MRRQLSIFLVVLLAFSASAFWIGRHEAIPQTPSTAVSDARTALPIAKIREAFTLLPCSKATTIGTEGCAEHRILALDGRIDTSRQRVLHYLRTRVAKRHFARAEWDWFAFRQSNCLSEADAYQGGSLAPVVFADCLIHINQQHLIELAAEKSNYTAA